jgi:hypothetical protein
MCWKSTKSKYFFRNMSKDALNIAGVCDKEEVSSFQSSTIGSLLY